MKPVRLAAAATLALPRWALFALGLLYILPGLVGRDPWKDDAASFGTIWTMAQGGINDWLLPNIAGLPQVDDGPLLFWLGAVCVKLLGPLLGDVTAARAANLLTFLMGALSVWSATFHLGRRADAQPQRLAFGGQPEPDDYGRTLADTALLIYLGSLGLLWHSHLLVPAALQIALLAYALCRTVRYVDLPSWRNAALLGLSLGLLTLTRDAVPAAALTVSLVVCTRFLNLPSARSLAHLGFALLCALLVVAVWVVPATLGAPYGQSPIPAWLAAQTLQFGPPTQASIAGYFRFGIWLFWPAWPFALWAAYAWRRQSGLLHIVLPLTFVITLTILWLCRPVADQSRLLMLLPPLAIMAAFGLPTMKRGAINAIDWFSVMVLTMLAAILWLGWSAGLTGWPAQLAKNVLKLVPGYKPELHLLAFIVATLATLGWIWLVHWRISRQPSVLWRAVVLSSGGLILLWVLLMTLFLPVLNYGKSYASVAQQMAQKLPANAGCIDTNVGPAQRASFAYFAQLKFAGFRGDSNCSLLLLQDSVKLRDEIENLPQYRGKDWVLVWEGRRPSDRDERFRLFRRK